MFEILRSEADFLDEINEQLLGDYHHMGFNSEEIVILIVLVEADGGKIYIGDIGSTDEVLDVEHKVIGGEDGTTKS